MRLRRSLLPNLSIAASYFLAGQVGDLISVGPACVSPLWPAAGVALGAALLRGASILPGIWLGAFLNGLTLAGRLPDEPGWPWLVAVALVSMAATVQALVGATLVHRLRGDRPLLDSVRGVVVLLGLGAAGASLIDATIGPALMAWVGLVPWSDFLPTAGAWWLGDAVGAAVTAPAVMALFASPFQRHDGPPAAAAYLAVLLGFGHLAFRGTDIAGFVVMPYLLFPLFLWAVFWFGQRVATGALLLVGTVATWHTVRGSGPYASSSALLSLAQLDTFLGVAVISTLLLGAALAERDLASREAAESDRLFRAFMRFCPAGAFIKDPDGRFVFVNRVVEENLGLRPSAWQGKTNEQLFAPEVARQFTEAGRQVLDTGKPAKFLGTIRSGPGGEGGSCRDGVGTRDGVESHWLVHLFPVELHGRQHLGGFAADITALVRAQREVKVANQRLVEVDRYKDEFLAVLGHELRTPLNLVTGFAGILADELEGPLNERQHERVQDIERAAQRMLGLVEDLLDAARILSGKLQLAVQREEFAPIVRGAISALRPLAELRQISIEGAVQAGLSAEVDGPWVHKAIMKLLSNAIKFTDAGGRVTVRAYQIEGGVMVEVEDTGPGIPEARLSDLFKRFQQLDMSSTRVAGGLGLGLVIAKGIVEAHGGTIGVLSKPEAGSRFWFTLPDRIPGPADRQTVHEAAKTRPVARPD